ncbi:Acetate kinase [Lunatimonas lonarensis]|uniref:Acetate kinase n=1 Tax=Lunatimonas lonarensis TaxID=1232681 RepID=R7ZMV0_9BACT|nr:acetate kinase [Lunatimonas lonarensis]EON75344.1 Acetate kinase [Lunatimonas lonarensis]
MKILVINSGSSSLKYQLFDMPSETPLCVGLVDRIGLQNSVLTHNVQRDGQQLVFRVDVPIPDHKAALLKVTDLLTDSEAGVLDRLDEVAAIGHRVVHGGEEFSSTTLVTAAVRASIEELISLAPLHNPPNLLGIEVAQDLFPNARQVAVFDTAYHQTMPARAYRYAVPRELYPQQGIRAYGFHGTSHQYVTQRAISYLGRPKSKLISIHLGNGCSITAVQDGKSVDHSMGLGPMGGLVMGTRCGDIDPSVIFHLIREKGFSVKEVNDLFNKKSGLLGLCGYSDMRDVKNAIAEGNEEAKLAYELYAYRIKKYIGSYAAVLNGLDALIFTAGVGENDPDMREAVCTSMDFLGIRLDNEKNHAAGQGIREIQADASSVKILVVPTNEELEIGLQTYHLVSSEQAAG